MSINLLDLFLIKTATPLSLNWLARVILKVTRSECDQAQQKKTREMIPGLFLYCYTDNVLPTTGLVAKSGHRTPRSTITCALSLAHGLLNGWVALTFSS